MARLRPRVKSRSGPSVHVLMPVRSVSCDPNHMCAETRKDRSCEQHHCGVAARRESTCGALASPYEPEGGCMRSTSIGRLRPRCWSRHRRYTQADGSTGEGSRVRSPPDVPRSGGMADGIGCPTAPGRRLSFRRTSPRSGGGRIRIRPARPAISKDKKNEGLLLAKTGPTNNNAAAVATLDGVKGTKVTELGYDIRKGGAPGSAIGSHCGAGAHDSTSRPRMAGSTSSAATLRPGRRRRRAPGGLDYAGVGRFRCWRSTPRPGRSTTSPGRGEADHDRLRRGTGRIRRS